MGSTEKSAAKEEEDEKDLENWFHGGIGSREESEQILRDHGLSEGLFLVRSSSSAPGDYVLSVVHLDKAVHYQIRRRGEDALFSLSEEDKVKKSLGCCDQTFEI